LQQHKHLSDDIPIWKSIVFGIIFHKILAIFKVTYLLSDKTYINQIL